MFSRGKTNVLCAWGGVRPSFRLNGSVGDRCLVSF